MCMESLSLMFFLNSLFFYDREGQPLKLPDTKRTLLFTFNGKCSYGEYGFFLKDSNKKLQ